MHVEPHVCAQMLGFSTLGEVAPADGLSSSDNLFVIRTKCDAVGTVRKHATLLFVRQLFVQYLDTL